MRTTYAVCERHKDGSECLFIWATKERAQAICDELNATKPKTTRYGKIDWGEVDCFFVDIVEEFDTTGN